MDQNGVIYYLHLTSKVILSSPRFKDPWLMNRQN